MSIALILLLSLGVTLGATIAGSVIAVRLKKSRRAWRLTISYESSDGSKINQNGSIE
jgi:hypothetical protein